MPVVILVIVLLLAMMAFALIMLPVSIVMRYRAGKARRRARGWITSINLFAATLSTLILIGSAAVSNFWIPQAFFYTICGFGVGCLLGLLGLAAARWEATHQTLHYTPNRWLILAITLVVTSRIFYSFWRGWQAWQATLSHKSFLDAVGAAQSMAAGAVVLGYYVVFWAGLRWRLRKY
jgi:hypothetical protein